MMDRWEKLSSEYIFQDRWLAMRVESYRTPEGQIIKPYYMREFADWVNCVTFTADLQAVLLRQYRPGAHEYLYEIPAGSIEPTDASPLAAARRELEEETGYQGGELFEIGSFWSNPAIQTNRTHCFIALGGHTTPYTNREITESISVYQTTLPEMLADIEKPSAEPRYQGLHLAAILQAINFIKQSNHPDAIKLRQQLQ